MTAERAFSAYIKNVEKTFAKGNATEHSYRSDLQLFLKELLPGIDVTNEPKRIECGAPDYVLSDQGIDVGYVEAKDIKISLSDKSHKNQLDKYLKALPNLAFTNYLDFCFYTDGKLIGEVTLGKVANDKIRPINEKLDLFCELLKSFVPLSPGSIKNPERLAELMAAQTRLLAEAIEEALKSDDDSRANRDLKLQKRSVQKALISDIDDKGFADLYAQTIAYGMFSARFYDTTLDDFSCQEAGALIPNAVPFMRKFFQHNVVYDLDDRVAWIVKALENIFKATDIQALLCRTANASDPIIYFYETFLSKYNPEIKKSRGVWYTPEPIVDFIVRGTDEILKKEFGLLEGLADSSKVSQTVTNKDDNGKEIVAVKEMHKVQILDPATGTGTFLAEVVKNVYKSFEGQAGAWSSYAKDHLIPRLNGFEVLAPPYAIAHLKMDMLLAETGAKKTKDQRFRIYLTNALEEYREIGENLFERWLAEEAKEANEVKRDTPVMCVIGNPPYSVASSNKSDWITGLLKDYKKEPGGDIPIKEKNIQPLSDDYLKFIRCGQYFIEQNQTGVLAFICPHGFLDGLTFRGMRYNLLKTFDKIYTLDLHGNAKKKEKTPEGGKDENVFDIQQGVSINFFIKTGEKQAGDLGRVFHADLYGKRKKKYDFLHENNINTTPYAEIFPVTPHYFYVPKQAEDKQYESGFSIIALMKENNSGIKTHKDSFCIQFEQKILENNIKDFLQLSDENVRTKFNLGADTRDWRVSFMRDDLAKNTGEIKPIVYRPFDTRVTFYTGKTKGFHAYPRKEIMRHFLVDENLGLITCKQIAINTWDHCFVSQTISDICTISSQTKESGYFFPLYLYPDNSESESLPGVDISSRTPNFCRNILQKLLDGLKLEFISDHAKDAEHGKPDKKTVNPLDILDYIYAVLHSPTYRETYKSFLKIDFPKIPYPTDAAKFFLLVGLGRELRLYHLLEHEKLIRKNFITVYTEGSDIIENKIAAKDWRFDEETKTYRVYINKEQYFGGIPENVKDFYIGGYQPAQKWLKDRCGRTLSYEDNVHYQKMIMALSETARLMKEIDEVGF